jgi:hypothetical protein
MTRKLTEKEYNLAKWLLEHGNDDAHHYIDQLENAEATEWKCKCGCASFNFKIKNKPEAEPGVHILSDYLFGDDATLAGVFIFSSKGVLSGLEVYGLTVDAPSVLPEPYELHPFESATKS